jgi:hypothetical protein
MLLFKIQGGKILDYGLILRVREPKIFRITAASE